MAARLVQLTANTRHRDAICDIAEKNGVTVERIVEADEDRFYATLLVAAGVQQEFYDAVQNCLDGDQAWRMIVLPVQAVLPEPDEFQTDEVVEDSDTASREELYNQVADGARLDPTRLALTVISAVVACAGMVTDSVAVVIGAMVIAPLLGPLLALCLGTTLGDLGLVLKATRSAAIGIALAVIVGAAFALVVPFNPGSEEIALRMDVGLDNVGLALAAGAAAALTVTTGISGAMVGVMVAVALLPPAATLGMLVGKGALFYASGAGLLLAVNIAAVTLAGQIVFVLKGIRPRTWYENKNARQSIAISIVFWTSVLLVLAGLIWLRGTFLA